MRSCTIPSIGYAPMGAGHYIRNTGSGILRMLIAFNSPHYRAHDHNTFGYWQLIADNAPRKTRSAIPHRESFPAIAGEIVSRVLIRKVQIPQ